MRPALRVSACRWFHKKAAANIKAVQEHGSVGDFDPGLASLGGPGGWDDLGLDALSDEFSFANDMTFDLFI